MRFLIQKMALTDPRGASTWDHGQGPEPCCEADGVSAESVLTRFVREHSDIEVGTGAIFCDGQAVIVARSGTVLYALRAVPLGPRPALVRSSSGRTVRPWTTIEKITIP